MARLLICICFCTCFLNIVPQFSLAAGAVCSSFCIFRTDKQLCTFVQLSEEDEIVRIAWEKLVARCVGDYGGIVTITTPTSKSACQEQAFTAATPYVSCFQ